MTKRRNSCILCGAALSGEPLIGIDNMPAAAQNLPSPEDAETEHGIQVRLCHCPSCGLVQLDNEPVGYYRDVIRSGGWSTTMDRLRRSQYDAWIPAMGLEGKKILEAGCGQGEFLSILADYPVRAFGMEHKADLCEKAEKLGLTVECAYPETADQKFSNAPFDGFTSFNFLEHQPDPVRYLTAIANNLTEDGVGLVTVPSFEYILEENSFYELIPDHLAYFTEASLTQLMEKCGFSVLKKERINRDTISVWVKKKTAGEASDAVHAAVDPRPDVSGLIRRKTDIEDEVHALLERLIKEGKTAAVWGASHQGFTLCAVADLKDRVRYIIDSAPFKQGKIAPASHISIISPNEAAKDPVDMILIIAPGYTDEIAGVIREKFPQETEIQVLMTDHLMKYGEA